MLKERKFALISLILGIIGLFYSALIVGVIALTLVIISITKDYRGKEVTGGLILGIICICSLIVQIMGLNFYFLISMKKINLAFLTGPLTPDMILTHLFSMSERVNRHLKALMVGTFTGGAIPFHWIYSIVYNL